MTTGCDVAVIGAGPAGALAALRAGDLGARTVLVTRAEFGGMAASDGPIPVRTLAHAARLMREARQLGDYGIAVGEPTLDYVRLLARVGSVVDDVRRHSALRAQVDAAGVRVLERSGWARFAGPHAIETERGERVNAEKVIVCTGGVSRKLPIPGFELTCTHSDAWELSSVPASMLVIAGVRSKRSIVPKSSCTSIPDARNTAATAAETSWSSVVKMRGPAWKSSTRVPNA